MRHSRPAILAAFAAIYVIWGSTYLAIAVAIETLPPFLMAGTRFLMAGLPLLLWLRWRGVPMPSFVHWKSGFLLGALMMFGGNGMVTWAEQHVPSSVAAVLIAMVPIWMTVLDSLLYRGGRLRGGAILGLLLGFGGVAVLMSPSGSEVESVHLQGAAVLVLAALSWAIGSLQSRRVELPQSPLMAVATQMIGGGLILLLVGSIFGEWGRFDPAAVSLKSIVSMVYLAIFGSIVALTSYVWLLRVSSAAAVSTYAFVNPVVAVLLGWGLAGEHLGQRTLIASALIIIAVVLILATRMRAMRDAEVEVEEACTALAEPEQA